MTAISIGLLLQFTRILILKWTQAEINKFEQTIKKAITAHGAIHSEANIQRLHMKRDKAECDLISMQKWIDNE